MTTTRRAPLRLVIAAILAAFVGALAVAPAHAAAYRFWSFYQLTDGAWAFAQKGSDQTTPADGAVDGWRFAVSDVSDSRFPRAVLTFDQVCGSTPAQDGKKRVGVVIDYGRAADSADNATPPKPKAACAVLANDATSTDALRTAGGDLRIEKQLVCAVSGYPSTECGGEVATVGADTKASDTPVTIAVPAATSAAATPAAASTGAAPQAEAHTTNDTAASGSNTTAYVLVGIVLLALVAFLLIRARSAATKRDA